MKEKSTAEVPLVRPSLNREAVPRGPKTFVARYAHLDFVCENVQKEGSCYVTEDGYRLRFVHRATTAVKLRDAPLPKLAVVEVLYTAPSRTRHRLRSAMHTTNAIRKEEGSCAGCP